MKKGIVTGVCLLSAVFCGAQVYHAGQTAPAATASEKKWEVSAAALRANQRVRDQVGERMLKNKDAFTARGLYYPVRWLGVGLEGTWFDKQHFAGQHTYEQTYYGVVSKWILTPDTTPAAYVLAGAGKAEQKMNYAHLFSRTHHVWYAQVGLGVEMPVYRGFFVAAEGQLVYHAKKNIDEFLQLEKRWGRQLLLRGGVRF